MKHNDISNTVAKRLWFVVEGYLYDEEALYRVDVPRKWFQRKQTAPPRYIQYPGSAEVIHRLLWSHSVPVALATFAPEEIFSDMESRIEMLIGAPLFRFEDPTELRKGTNILSTWAVCDSDKMRVLAYGGVGLHLLPGQAPLGT